MRLLAPASFVLLLILTGCNRPADDASAPHQVSPSSPPPSAPTNAASAAKSAPILAPKSPIVVSDTFQENANAGEFQNTQIEGVKPAPVDLPGAAWQLAVGDGNYETYLTSPGDLGLISVFHNTASAGLSLASTGTYVKPTTITVSADLCFNGDPSTGFALLGFYSALTGPHSGNTLANYTGLALYEDGSLHLIEKGADSNHAIKFKGSFDPLQGATLRYTVDTTKGTISDISLSGSKSDYAFTTSAFTDAATAFVGIGGTTGGQTTVLVNNLIVASGVYVPPSSDAQATPDATSATNAATADVAPATNAP